MVGGSLECMSYSSPLGEPCWALCRVARGSNKVAQFVFGSTRLFVLLKFPLPTAWWHNPLRNLSAVLNSSKLPVFCPNRIIFYVQRNWPVGLLGACQQCYHELSSPCAKCAGPKGLHAESARAFTGRRNSHSGRGI